MIESLLIANRGEIAVRIIRACKELGIRTVAIYSEADREGLHVKMADKAVCVGPAPSKLSYLNMDNIVMAAITTHCDAIHPGVGFLAENSAFARKILKAGLIWIGPDPDTIDLLGDKVQAKETAAKYGVPCIPGIEGSIQDYQQAIKAAEKIGYPVIVKAAAGGGGKGMRIVKEPKELEANLKIAGAEAEAAFGDGTVYLEKYIIDGAHVELQMLGDSHGNVVYLGERDCSVQRNHQKLIEESPSPLVTPEIRLKMGEDAVRMFSGLNYVGAGTIEFLFKDGQYYFMEVNARIQVEHPVTETVTGIDLLKEQILVCTGEKMRFTQDEIRFDRYAMEVRVNATAPGRVIEFRPPSGFMVRVDTFLYNGYQVPPFYDSMVAKVIIGARNRQEGIQKMLAVLSEFYLEGVPTNLDEQMKILNSPTFRKGGFGTGALDRIMKEIG